MSKYTEILIYFGGLLFVCFLSGIVGYFGQKIGCLMIISSVLLPVLIGVGGGILAAKITDK